MAAIAYNPVQVKSSNVSSGPQTFTVDVPTGRRLTAMALSTAANNKQVVITSVKPFVNKAQTVVGSSQYFINASTSVPVTSVTLASTSTTRGDLYSLLIHKVPAVGDSATGVQLGPISAYGFQVVVTCTASGGSGSWNLAFVSEV